MTIAAEFALTLFLALSAGFALLRAVPGGAEIGRVQFARWLQSSAAGAMVAALAVLAGTAQTFADAFDMRFSAAFLQVLYGTDAGLSWIGMLAAATVLQGILLFADSAQTRLTRFAPVFVLAVLMVCYARSRHVSVLDPAAGFLAQAAHVLAVFAWMGLLLIFAWFSREEVQWKNVLSWFSPLAVLCMVCIVVSGLSVMGFVAPEYVYSWVLPYGQALLIKHLLLLPLMALAFLNGFLHPYRLRKNADLKPWFKAESVLAVAVLAVTAYMGRQVPPHDVSSVLLNEPPSSLFLMLYPGEFSPGQPLRLSPTPEGAALALMALAMFALSGYFYVRLRRIPVFFTAFSIALGLVLAYAAAMLMIRQT